MGVHGAAGQGVGVQGLARLPQVSVGVDVALGGGFVGVGVGVQGLLSSLEHGSVGDGVIGVGVQGLLSSRSHGSVGVDVGFSGVEVHVAGPPASSLQPPSSNVGDGVKLPRLGLVDVGVRLPRFGMVGVPVKYSSVAVAVRLAGGV